MLEQFQKILQTPKPFEQTYLKKVQDTMLNTMEHMLPQDFDFDQLAKIFQKESDCDNLASLTFKLTEYFVKIIGQNFISLQSYFLLEQQTQKLQSTVRGHIKMQQQMKMYLQHLEYKIQRYEYHLQKLRKRNHENIQQVLEQKQTKEKDNVQYLKKKETQLLKQRLVLLRKVDHLQRKLRDQQNEMRRLKSPTSATIQQIKQGLINKEKQIDDPVPALNLLQINKKENQQLDHRQSSYSLGSDNQLTQKKTTMPTNGTQIYRLYSLTGKDQILPNVLGFNRQQWGQTKKQIKIEGNKDFTISENSSPIQLLCKDD